jgi:drug/metabolite transporter (DMT)-like permease
MKGDVGPVKIQSGAYTYALLTVLLWSTVATAFKIALRDLNNVQLLLIANATSWLIFLILILWQGKFNLLKHSSLKYLGLSALQGFVNPFAYYLILFKAYSILPAQVAQPANFIWPVVLMLLSAPLLHQPIRITGFLALLISFSGVLVLSSQGELSDFKVNNPYGLAICLLSSLIWSFFWIINIKDIRDDLIKLFLSFTFSMCFIIILAGFTGDLSAVLHKPVLPAIYVGLFEMGISFVFWLKALRMSSSTGKVANLIYLTPFLSLIIIHVVLHEELYYTSFIGLCLIIMGILIGRIKKETS